MSLDIEKVKHLAMLAKLDLQEGEAEVYSQQLSEVLHHLDSLNLAMSEMTAGQDERVVNNDEMKMVLRLDEVV